MNRQTKQLPPLSRRHFLGATAALAWAGANDPLRCLTAGAGYSRRKLREFDYAAVRLTGGPLKAQFDRIHAAYLALDNDRLLKVYRQRAGLPAPGEDMGGWYDAEGFCPGHSLGQYISGLARFARATGDRASFAKVHDLVSGYAATLGKHGYPYASAKAASFWPCYIFDKHLIGLLDAYRLTGMQLARQLLPHVLEGALPYLPGRVHDRVGVRHLPYDEPYILPENCFKAYAATGDRRFLEQGKKYLLEGEYFEPLARGQNILPGRQAYSHVMALSSAAKAYELFGAERNLECLRNAWTILATTQEFASGGWGPDEEFVPPGEGKLGASLLTTHRHFETPCGCYAHGKLARYLLGFHADSRYGDGLERVLYNTVLGAKDPRGDGHFFYYSDYSPSARKGYYPDKWPCCSGTLVQDVADYLRGIYFHGAAGIFVNLFTPSQVHWRWQGMPVRLTQSTAYPLEGEIHLRLEMSAAAEFTLFLRLPAWLESSPRLSINGHGWSGEATPGRFAALRRRWRPDDEITLELPLRFRSRSVDGQHPDTVALLRGPLALVELDPPPNLFARPLRLRAGWRPVSHHSGQFALADHPRLRFTPFYLAGEERYSSYIRCDSRDKETP